MWRLRLNLNKEALQKEKRKKEFPAGIVWPQLAAKWQRETTDKD